MVGHFYRGPVCLVEHLAAPDIAPRLRLRLNLIRSMCTFTPCRVPSPTKSRAVRRHMLYTSILFPPDRNVPRQPAGRHEIVLMPKEELVVACISCGRSVRRAARTPIRPPNHFQQQEIQPPNFCNLQAGQHRPCPARGPAGERARLQDTASSASKGISGVGVGASRDSQVPQAGGAAAPGDRHSSFPLPRT